MTPVTKDVSKSCIAKALIEVKTYLFRMVVKGNAKTFAFEKRKLIFWLSFFFYFFAIKEARKLNQNGGDKKEDEKRLDQLTDCVMEKNQRNK